MGFVDAVKSGFSRYVDFKGRSARSEYWWWLLFFMIGYVIFLALISVSDIFGIVGGIFYLAMISPSIAVAIRRLHDLDKSGWWYLLSFVPLANFVLIYWFCLRGTVGPNQYGMDPLGASADTFD